MTKLTLWKAVAAISVGMFGLSSAAFGWGSDIGQSREIYRDTIAVKMANGKIGHAILAFTVSATSYVGEDGNANWPDNRACYYREVRRTLIRSLIFIAPDGTAIPVRDTNVALPDVGGYHWGSVTPCNDKIGEINERLLNAVGNADTWKSYIDGERAEVGRILSQFGQVT